MTCPDLRGEPDPDLQTARRHEQVIAAVTGFCPDVEVVEPGVCAFGARGPARYFGGETALAARIIAALADLGVAGRVGVADGLFAALLAARDGTIVSPGGTARFLAAQPVSVLARDRGQDLEPRIWQHCWSGWACARSGISPRCPSATWPAGSATRGRARTGWPAAWTPGRSRPARRPRTCPWSRSSTRRNRGPSRWCSRPRRWPDGCTTAWPPAG